MWIHLTSVIQVQVLILHVCVLLERKSRGTYSHVPNCVLVMTPKQTIHQDLMIYDTRTRRKTTRKENRDQITEQNLQDEGGYLCQDHKEATFHKSTGDRPLIPKPSSNTPYAPCYMLTARKERGSNPNFFPVCSIQRADI